MTDREQGMPILKRTNCVVGRHVWIHASPSSEEKSWPAADQRCECGLFAWHERAGRSD